MGEKKVKLSTIFFSFLVIALFYLAIIGVAIYFLPLTGSFSKNAIVKKTVQVVPYPAALAGGKSVSVGKLSKNLESVKNFYTNQDFSKLGLRVDFATEDGKKRLRIKERDILNKLIEDAIIESEARKRDIVITPDMVNQEVDRKLNEYGTGDYLKENLQKLYGWDENDFKENIVSPDLYKERLADNLKKNNPDFIEAKKKIEEAKADLENGMSFGEAVKKYSQGDSAKNEGELGWFSADQILPELIMPVFNLEKNQTSDAIESSVGFHIIKLDDKKTENNIPMVKVSQIFLRIQSFSDWLDEAEKDYRVTIPIREFKWNSQERKVEFRDKKMNDYEQELLKNPVNDPSVLF